MGWCFHSGGCWFWDNWSECLKATHNLFDEAELMLKPRQKAKIDQLILSAREEYPWEKISRHLTYDVPHTNLDVDPATIEYQTCYMLPKEWVDHELAALQKERK
jgi:hypothetical protein